MQKLKNSLVGFLISFVGSIPLGYLNVIGYQIYAKNGLHSTLAYLFGVVLVEGIVIYGTLKFANFLALQKKWIKRIDMFSICFLLVLGMSFFLQSASSTTNSALISRLPFFTGLIFSGLNFIQIPFWMSWNLYLVNNKYISIAKPIYYFYIFGTIFGTFFGMLGLILGLSYLSQSNLILNALIISKAIPILFFGMAIFQIIQFYRKYYLDKNQK